MEVSQRKNKPPSQSETVIRLMACHRLNYRLIRARMPQDDLEISRYGRRGKRTENPCRTSAHSLAAVGVIGNRETRKMAEVLCAKVQISEGCRPSRVLRWLSLPVWSRSISVPSCPPAVGRVELALDLHLIGARFAQDGCRSPSDSVSGLVRY